MFSALQNTAGVSPVPLDILTLHPDPLREENPRVWSTQVATASRPSFRVRPLGHQEPAPKCPALCTGLWAEAGT